MSLARSEASASDSNGGSVRMLAYALLAASLLLNTRAPSGIVVLYGFACVVPAVFTYLRVFRERNRDNNPGQLKTAPAYPGDRREFRQRLPRNPFDSLSADLSLDERITAAAELCAQYDRKAIVLSLRFDEIGREDLDKAALTAHRLVRKTDLVEVVSEHEILVGLAMVHDFEAAALVMDRLRKAFAFGGVKISSGAAIYPLHGYSGAELIAAARKNSRGWAALLTA
jgi:hypothetical protein